MALFYDLGKVGRDISQSLNYIYYIIFYAFTLYFHILYKPVTLFFSNWLIKEKHLTPSWRRLLSYHSGTNFRAFRSFCPKSRKFVPTNYSISLKPRKLIPAKKIEKKSRISRNFPPLWQIAVRDKKCKLIL